MVPDKKLGNEFFLIALALVVIGAVNVTISLKENGTWSTVTDDYFVPTKEVTPGQGIAHGWSPSSQLTTEECQKAKREYGYTLTPDIGILGPCSGYILEFNRNKEANDCFETIITSFKNRNATDNLYFVGFQPVRSLTSPSLKPAYLWTHNRFVFSLNYNSLECDEYRETIISYMRPGHNFPIVNFDWLCSFQLPSMCFNALSGLPVR